MLKIFSKLLPVCEKSCLRTSDSFKKILNRNVSFMLVVLFYENEFWIIFAEADKEMCPAKIMYSTVI